MTQTAFESQWAAAAGSLAGPPLTEAHSKARIELWRRQEWHDWFRWRLCRRGMDWSKPIWLGTLALGLIALIVVGMATRRWEITAGGIVAWFTVINLGFLGYLGLRTSLPPLPIPGPFPAAAPFRARMAVYPAGYDGRKLSRILFRVRSAVSSGPHAESDFVFELTEPGGHASDLEELVKRQAAFRMQQGDAPEVRAVCEVADLTRKEIDAGRHPIRLVAWNWELEQSVPFGRIDKEKKGTSRQDNPVSIALQPGSARESEKAG